MNSLEDAYINIAKAEEKLHNEHNENYIIDKTNEEAEDFAKYLQITAHPNFCQQVGAMFVRRMKQFAREPRMWLLLASPFVTIIMSFLLMSGLLPKDNTNPAFTEAMTLITSYLFAFFILIGFALCSGLFILSPVLDKENKLRSMLNFMGMKSLAYYLGNLFADLILFSIPTVGFILLLFPLKITLFIVNGTWAVLLAVMVSFGFALINLTYLLSFLFKSHNNAFKQIGLIYLIGGTILPSFVGGILTGAGGLDTFHFYRKIFFFDPFWNFSDAMILNMITNFIDINVTDPASR